MKVTLEYNFTNFDGVYCERIREYTINKLATLKETKEEALKTIYKALPAGVSWRMEARESGKVVLTAWGYGYTLDGYTTASN
jgi:antirestriction protein